MLEIVYVHVFYIVLEMILMLAVIDFMDFLALLGTLNYNYFNVYPAETYGNVHVNSLCSDQGMVCTAGLHGHLASWLAWSFFGLPFAWILCF